MDLSIPCAHLESIFPKVQCNSSNSDLKFKNSKFASNQKLQISLWIWNQKPSVIAARPPTPSVECDHITPLTRAYESADHVGVKIYLIPSHESFSRYQASELFSNKEIQVHSDIYD